MVQSCKCAKCGHEWIQKGYVKPENDRCPNHECRTYNWRTGIDKPKNGGIGPAIIVDGRKRCSNKNHVGERMVPLSGFSIDRRNKSGYCHQCKVCANQKRREYTARNQARIRKNQIAYWSTRAHRYWSYGTIKNHQKQGLEINFTLDDLEIFAKKSKSCAICGRTLVWGGKGMAQETPTLDRTSNGNTLRLDNIQIICHQCNRSKGERTMNEFVDYCRKIVEKFGGDPPLY